MIKQLKPMLLQALRVLCYKAFTAFYISQMTGDSALTSRAFYILSVPIQSYKLLEFVLFVSCISSDFASIQNFLPFLYPALCFQYNEAYF